MQRIAYLDNIRNFANALRMCIHAGVPYMVTVSDMWPVNDKGNWTFDFIIFEAHLFVMELFFLVAGFMFAMQYPRKKTIDFIINRLQRIVIPFFAGMFFLVPFVLMMFGLSKHPTNQLLNSDVIVRSFNDGIDLGLQNFFPTAHLWFLYYLILFYILSLILVRTNFYTLLSKVNFIGIISFGCVISFIAMFFTDKWIIENPLTLLPETTSFFHFLLFFIGGQLLYNNSRFKSLESYAGTIFLGGLAIGLIAAFCQLSYENIDHPHYSKIAYLARASYVVSSYMLTYGCWFFIKKHFFKTTPRLQYVANASYWIYLVNMPIVMLLHLLLIPLNIPIFIKFLLVLFLAGFLSLWSYSLKKIVKNKLSRS